MGGYKLTYFNLKVLGEPIRFMFAYANQPYEDDRVEMAEWGAKKQTLTWGQLPILTLEDGREITQAVAICQLLAKRLNLLPSDEVDQARCLELALHVQECRTKWMAFYLEQDLEKREEIRKDLIKNVFPNFLKGYNGVIAKNGGTYVTGNKVTWADFFLANFLEIWSDTIDSKLLDPYPALKKQVSSVFNIPQIKEWVEKRPKGDYFGLII